MKKLLFISNIGLNKKVAPNGVNVKNRHLLKFLKDSKNLNVKLIDTDNWKLKITQILFSIIFYSFNHNRIILSIDTNSAYKVVRYFNLLGLDNKLIYVVVGGSLPQKLKNKDLNIKYYKNIKNIFVQTLKMERDLKNLGLANVERLPNSKYFDEIEMNYKQKVTLPIKCFYIGRIHPEKGIEMIFNTFKKMNKLNNTKFVIDFYGPIEKKYEREFMDQVNKYSYLNYKGIIDFIEDDNAYYKLSRYDLFIFPTYWRGEGFPGVVIDSFISGVPVLASDWNHNPEIIKDGYNGFLFETKNGIDLEEKLESIYKNKDILLKMSENAHKEARRYKAENVLKKLNKYIY